MTCVELSAGLGPGSPCRLAGLGRAGCLDTSVVPCEGAPSLRHSPTTHHPPATHAGTGTAMQMVLPTFAQCTTWPATPGASAYCEDVVRKCLNI